MQMLSKDQIAKKYTLEGNKSVKESFVVIF
jgi:hypothetical protein